MERLFKAPKSEEFSYDIDSSIRLLQENARTSFQEGKLHLKQTQQDLEWQFSNIKNQYEKYTHLGKDQTLPLSKPFISDPPPKTEEMRKRLHLNYKHIIQDSLSPVQFDFSASDTKYKKAANGHTKPSLKKEKAIINSSRASVSQNTPFALEEKLKEKHDMLALKQDMSELKDKINRLELKFIERNETYQNLEYMLKDMRNEIGRIKKDIQIAPKNALQQKHTDKIPLPKDKTPTIEKLKSNARKNLEKLTVSKEFRHTLHDLKKVFLSANKPFNYQNIQTYIDYSNPDTFKKNLTKETLRNLADLHIDWWEQFLSFINALGPEPIKEQYVRTPLNQLAKHLSLELIIPKKGDKYEPTFHSPYSEEKCGLVRGCIVKTISPGVFDTKSKETIQKAKVVVSK